MYLIFFIWFLKEAGFLKVLSSGTSCTLLGLSVSLKCEETGTERSFDASASCFKSQSLREEYKISNPVVGEGGRKNSSLTLL